MSVNEKMTAIADAIRERTGGTEPLTLDQMAAEIAEIETDPVLEELTITENGEYTPGEGVDGFSKVVANVAGGGARIATGSFTMANESSITPEIVHNLGTKKIIALFWIAHNEVISTKGYQALAASFINVPEFITEPISVDCTSYNTKVTEPIIADFNELCLGGTIRTPWTSQNDLAGPNNVIGKPSFSTITENTLIFSATAGGQSAFFISGYTYNYLIIGL